jgi:glycosyltransferase involved in cell wall biosynthesis
MAPFTMALSSWRLVRALVRSGEVDIVDAHYFYPDGIAAALLAYVFRKPLVVTARGTDINVLPNYAFSRALIRWAANRAVKIIAVSEALRSRLIDLGVDASKVVTLRNGVDQSEFRELDQASVRARLEIPNTTVLLTVGNLIESKGHHLAIESLRELDHAYLVVVGDGPMRASLERIARENGVADRVRFTGALGTSELVEYYNSADALVLATLREGMPNVVLEAISCGLPVVATDCGGIAEVVDRPEAGILMHERSAAAIVAAVRALRQRYPSRAETRASARRFDWGCTVNRQVELYATVVSETA